MSSMLRSVSHTLPPCCTVLGSIMLTHEAPAGLVQGSRVRCTPPPVAAGMSCVMAVGRLGRDDSASTAIIAQAPRQTRQLKLYPSTWAWTSWRGPSTDRHIFINMSNTQVGVGQPEQLPSSSLPAAPPPGLLTSITTSTKAILSTPGTSGNCRPVAVTISALTSQDASVPVAR